MSLRLTLLFWWHRLINHRDWRYVKNDMKLPD